jgi:hypothetical protein
MNNIKPNLDGLQNFEAVNEDLETNEAIQALSKAMLAPLTDAQGTVTIYGRELDLAEAQAKFKEALEYLNRRADQLNLPPEIRDQFDPRKIAFKYFSGNQMGDSTATGMTIDPIIFFHPVMTFCKLACHEAVHSNNLIQGEGATEAAAMKITEQAKTFSVYETEVREYLELIKGCGLDEIQTAVMAIKGQHMEILEAIINSKMPHLQNVDLEELLARHEQNPHAGDEANHIIKQFFKAYPSLKITTTGIEDETLGDLENALEETNSIQSGTAERAADVLQFPNNQPPEEPDESPLQRAA